MLMATTCPLSDLIFLEGLRAEFDARGQWEHERCRKSHVVLLRTDCVALTQCIIRDIH